MPEKITLDEIKQIIKAEKVSPSTLFGVEDLTGDPLVKSFIETTLHETKKKLSGEFEGRKRVEGEFETDKKEMDDKFKAIEEENKKLKLESAGVKATELFSAKIKERKVTPMQKGYLESKRDSFTPKDPEKLDSEVEAFLDDKLKECKEVGKIFGVKEEVPVPKGGAEESKDTPGEGPDFTPD